MGFLIGVYILLAIAALVGYVPIIKKNKKDRSLYLLLYTFGLVFIFRLMIVLLAAYRELDPFVIVQKLLDSLAHALQIFALNEDYTGYAVMCSELFTGLGSAEAGVFYSLFITVLNVCAPIFSGAEILKILTDIFPPLRIMVHPHKHKYVFCGLNEMTVSLAEDICGKGTYTGRDPGGNEHNGKSFTEWNYTMINKDCLSAPMIIFADCVPSEASQGLRSRAEALGAVCVRTDPTELRLSKSGSVTYLLLNEDPGKNIERFSALLSAGSAYLGDDKKKPLFPTDGGPDGSRTGIFVFVHEEYESGTVRRILEKNPGVKDKIAVRAIRDYMNVAINLMAKVPLFLPLLHNPKDELNITILGAGSIAREVFKAVYWCGQMNGVALNVNVLAKDATALQRHLGETCPEMAESCKAFSPLLRIYEDTEAQEYNPPYLNSVEFTDADDVAMLSDLPENILRTTDYYVIALGSDEADTRMTDLLSRRLGQLRMETKKGMLPKCPEVTFIVTALYEGGFAGAVRETKPGEAQAGTYILPFATFKERFSCQNVFFTSFMEDAIETQKLYDRNQQKKWTDDEYDWMANVVKEVHAPYKLFSAGLLTKPSASDKLYDIKIDSSAKDKIDDAVYKKLAWLEHRRWNAFLRSQGFSCPTRETVGNYVSVTEPRKGMHKNIPLRLHPCLVESSPVPTELLGLDQKPDPEKFASYPYDRLDYVSAYLIDLIPKYYSDYSMPPAIGYKTYDFYGYYDIDKKTNKLVWNGMDSALQKYIGQRSEPEDGQPHFL